jgi:phosphatidylglycerol---prolipoprotein diacylglyceryl transferase
MRPVLFELGGYSVYTYGFMIAIGAVAGVAYMVIQGKKEVGLSFDQANTLFLIIFFAAVIGGKVFLFFEEPSTYIAKPAALFRGSGFVFYGSFLFAVPAMLWYFRKNRLDTFKMLDVMAITTCLLHIFGRIGCFFAGCCHGTPADHFLAVTFTDPACYANPKGVPLHPTQLYEAGYIFLTMLYLLRLRNHRRFDGQLFLSYLILYAVGRFVIEFFRGDRGRGFIFENFLSHSQLIAAMIFAVAAYLYVRWSRRVVSPIARKV